MSFTPEHIRDLFIGLATGSHEAALDHLTGGWIAGLPVVEAKGIFVERSHAAEDELSRAEQSNLVTDIRSLASKPTGWISMPANWEEGTPGDVGVIVGKNGAAFVIKSGSVYGLVIAVSPSSESEVRFAVRYSTADMEVNGEAKEAMTELADKAFS